MEDGCSVWQAEVYWQHLVTFFVLQRIWPQEKDPCFVILVLDRGVSRALFFSNSS